MKIFLSYARINKAYCALVAQILNQYELWYDGRMYAGENWWERILQRLAWCDLFVYLLTSQSLASEYCKREYRIAVSSNKIILPLLLERDLVLPPDLQSLHYIDCTDGFTADVVKQILDTVHNYHLQWRERATYGSRPAPKPRSTPPTDPQSLNFSFGDIAEAMQNGDWDRALFMINRAAEANVSQYINLDALRVQAEQALQEQERHSQREADYRAIAELIKYPLTRPIGCQSFQLFRQDYPTYDPQGLARICGEALAAVDMPAPAVPLPMPSYTPAPAQVVAGLEAAPPPPPVPVATSTMPPRKSIQIQSQKIAPMLDWKPIRGDVLIPPFYLSRYPVTNGQYNAFLRHPKGYCQTRWWDYSADARAWRSAHPEPMNSHFTADNLPRENVSWYDAVAYTLWLSHFIGDTVTLPTLGQWRRAAQDGDHRLYPWGNEFNAAFCNSRESKLNRTTPVDRYPNGVSPFGVFDMVGNVWEMMLDGDHAQGTQAQMLAASGRRYIIGGSWNSQYTKLMITYHHSMERSFTHPTIGFRLALLPQA
ncbi:MAG: SUMF1/EgtB/PvdO family nonheme iron enzyme [Anaerolineae bacterium]|nr:SUMF1/EgtB/PvdO family nonheme iron enzyme [Anaerolineae bacterium]MDW8171537.1 SUMF1/EgtB/PvdO family nonheme iron enzyme [Anaerolineae bacterium]